MSIIDFGIRLLRSGPGPLHYLGRQEAAIALLLIFIGFAWLALNIGPSLVKGIYGSKTLRNLAWKIYLKFVLLKRQDGILIGDHWVSDTARLRHTHIVGATGSGKTVLLEQLIEADIKRGNGCLIIDAKGDRELYLRVREFCASVGRLKDLSLLSANYPGESVTWNPCEIGNPSDLQTKFYQSSIYDNPFYAKAVENGLLVGFSSLDAVFGERAFTVADLASELKRKFKGSTSESLEGLHLDLGNLTNSEWGPILGVKTKGHTPGVNFNLHDCVRDGKILFVDLPTESKAVQSSRIGRLVLQELMLISGSMKIRPESKPKRDFSVFVDEFDAFATQSFATFLNKGRSSGFMITIAHQNLSQLEKIGTGFSGDILGNTNLRFIFRQDDPKDAETWAKFIGTEEIEVSTFRKSDGKVTGDTSNRLAETFIIHPNKIKTLKVGECVFMMKDPLRRELLRIHYSEKQGPSICEPLAPAPPLKRRKSIQVSQNSEESSSA